MYIFMNSERLKIDIRVRYNFMFWFVLGPSGGQGGPPPMMPPVRMIGAMGPNDMCE